MNLKKCFLAVSVEVPLAGKRIQYRESMSSAIRFQPEKGRSLKTEMRRQARRLEVFPVSELRLLIRRSPERKEWQIHGSQSCQALQVVIPRNKNKIIFRLEPTER